MHKIIPTLNFPILREFRLLNLPFIIAALLCISVSGQTTLLVCIPGKQNTTQVQNGFDGLIGAQKSIVFNRIKDLDSALAVLPDAAVIAPEAFFSFTPGYTMVFSGKTGSTTGEKYHIVSTDKEITMQNIGEKKVGIVDFLGKDRLPQFVKNQFGVELKLLKRANKEEDLLTMLGMEAVSAIIVSASQYEEILSNTKLPLVIVASSSKNIGFMTYGIKEGKEDEARKKKLLKAPERLLKEIGIEGWEMR
jgi:hypothetical protein